MQLTDENKNYINSLSYESLLEHWRFAPIGDPWFCDETGDYWSKRMKELRELLLKRWISHNSFELRTFF